MKKINRLITNICSSKLQESKEFYITLFDFEVNFESDWFINFISKDKRFELGIIDQHNDIVPKPAQNPPDGFYLTFVVDDVDELYAKAEGLGIAIIEPPHDTFYGQRRLLLKDPDGVSVDVSAPIPNFQF